MVGLSVVHGISLRSVGTESCRVLNGTVVGEGWARELCLTGRIIDAEEAGRIGLVGRVVDSSMLYDTTRELATQITRAPRAALITTKSFFRVNPGLDDFIHRQHDQLFEADILFHDADRDDRDKDLA